MLAIQFQREEIGACAGKEFSKVKDHSAHLDPRECRAGSARSCVWEDRRALGLAKALGLVYRIGCLLKPALEEEIVMVAVQYCKCN